MQTIVILGSTGSIGCNTLDVIAKHPSEFQVFALTANKNIQLLAQQCQQFKPRYAVVINPQARAQLCDLLQQHQMSTEVLLGERALVEVACASEVDTVMAAIVGGAGLLPTFHAAKAGKRILLANKEALVMAGQLFVQAVASSGASVIPVDSEHNALLQCLPVDFKACHSTTHDVERLVLTASGGPFRSTPLAKLAEVTPAQAIAHPNWSMGAKISIDSATMMNKGLEVIEAHYLFNIPLKKIEVVIHPQSIVHALVQYTDGSTLAQIGYPDMRTPIACALSWPNRLATDVPRLDLLTLSKLDFDQLDLKRYPCLKIAMDAFQLGPAAVIALNAANEIAVEAFLQHQLRFDEIAPTIYSVIEQAQQIPVRDITTVVHLDQQARALTHQHIPKMLKTT